MPAELFTPLHCTPHRHQPRLLELVRAVHIGNTQQSNQHPSSWWREGGKRREGAPSSSILTGPPVAGRSEKGERGEGKGEEEIHIYAALHTTERQPVWAGGGTGGGGGADRTETRSRGTELCTTDGKTQSSG